MSNGPTHTLIVAILITKFIVFIFCVNNQCWLLEAIQSAVRHIQSICNLLISWNVNWSDAIWNKYTSKFVYYSCDSVSFTVVYCRCSHRKEIFHSDNRQMLADSSVKHNIFGLLPWPMSHGRQCIGNDEGMKWTFFRSIHQLIMSWALGNTINIWWQHAWLRINNVYNINVWFCNAGCGS